MPVTVRSDGHGTWDAFAAPTPPALQPLLRGIEGWAEHRRPGESVRRRELPIPGLVLMLQWGEPLETLDGSGACRRVLSFVAGPGRSWTDTAVRGAGAGLHIELHPLAARRLLGVPLSELSDRVVAVEDLQLPWIGALEARVADELRWDRRFAAVHETLTARMAESDGLAPEVVRAWQVVRRHGGRVPVAHVVQETGWSARHLAVRFRDAVGLTPKQASRVVRFERARSLLLDSCRSVSDVAAACGYYDQAHLDRDARAMAGVPASGVRRRTLVPPTSIRSDSSKP